MGVVQPSRRILRASDSERDSAVERLRRHGAAGRLSVTETTERIERALEAKTVGQLDELFVDLPADEPTGAKAPAGAFEERSSLWRSLPLWSSGLQLVLINVICLAIWLHDGGRGSWPFWVLLVSCLLVCRKAVRVARREQRRRQRALRRSEPPFGLR